MKYEGYQELQIGRSGRILTLTIDRPEVKNAINAATHEELSRIFTDVDRDAETDVVILTGAGGAFCGGGDITWMAARGV